MRAIDADTLRERLQNLACDDWNQGITTSFADACNEIIEIVEEQPTIEAEIIHCKDCVYWDSLPSSSLAPDYHHCAFGINTNLHTTADDFCGRAERRQECR